MYQNKAICQRNKWNNNNKRTIVHSIFIVIVVTVVGGNGNGDDDVISLNIVARATIFSPHLSLFLSFSFIVVVFLPSHRCRHYSVYLVLRKLNTHIILSFGIECRGRIRHIYAHTHTLTNKDSTYARYKCVAKWYFYYRDAIILKFLDRFRLCSSIIEFRIELHSHSSIRILRVRILSIFFSLLYYFCSFAMARTHPKMNSNGFYATSTRTSITMCDTYTDENCINISVNHKRWNQINEPKR